MVITEDQLALIVTRSKELNIEGAEKLFEMIKLIKDSKQEQDPLDETYSTILLNSGEEVQIFKDTIVLPDNMVRPFLKETVPHLN